MGGLGSHSHASFAMQTVAFLISLLLPASALVLVAGASWERARRNVRAKRSEAKQGSRRASLAAEPIAK